MADLRGYVTAAGQQFEALAKQMGYPVEIGVVEIGDGGLPDNESPISRTKLVNKIAEFPASVEQDPKNPGQWVVWIHIPADHAINGAGYFIREMGCKLVNQGAGVLYAYRRVSNDWKPVDTSGEAKSFIYKLRFIPGNGELLRPTIDPSVVMVDREELEQAMKAHKESRDHPAGTKIEKGMLRLATDDEAKAGENDSSATTPKGVALAISERYLKSGQPLPTKNIGPIWHDDYASWMVWQEFTANGANYRGYASQLIGSLLLDTQPTPRAGYIKSGVQNLSRTTYAALRAWALHNGLMVAPGVWIAGAIQCADNADGATFRIYDVRSEFFRALDDGRGVDTGRVFGSPQASANLSHFHVPEYAFLRREANPGGVNSPSSAYSKTYFEPTGEDGQLKRAANGSWGSGSVGLVDLPSGDTEARPRNSALLAAIKY